MDIILRLYQHACARRQPVVGRLPLQHARGALAQSRRFFGLGRPPGSKNKPKPPELPLRKSKKMIPTKSTPLVAQEGEISQSPRQSQARHDEGSTQGSTQGTPMPKAAPKTAPKAAPKTAPEIEAQLEPEVQPEPPRYGPSPIF